METLKLWNGRGAGKYQRGYHFYIAAYSKSQAVKIINEHAGDNITTHEISDYYSADCCGNPMDGIIPKTPCLYATLGYNKPFLIYKEPEYPYASKRPVKP